MPSCAVVGILPPSTDLFASIRKQINTIDGTSIEWRDEYSLVNDEERQNALTLLMTAIYEEPVTHENIVSAVEKELKSQDHCEEPCLCELWASAPAPVPLRPLDGYDKVVNIPAEDWDDQAPTTMQEHGILVQEKILTSDQVKEIRQIVDQAISNVESLLAKHRPGLTVGEDSFIFKEIASRNLERFDLRLDTVPGAADFVEKYIVSHPIVDSLLQKTLGSPDEINFDISVVYSRPGAVNQKWHADGSHQKGATDAGWDPKGWRTQLASAYALCLFIPLIDLDSETGYTQFWPASHRHKDLIGFGPVAELAKATYDGMCPAGDGVWYDYRLLHRGIFNVSDKVRPVIQVIFKKKWYVERVNYGKESIVRE